MRTLGTLVLLSALLSACSGAFGGSPEPATGDLEEMRQRIIELQRGAAVTKVELDRLRQEVAVLKAGRGMSGSSRATSLETAPMPEPIVSEDRPSVEPAGGGGVIEESDLEPAAAPAGSASKDIGAPGLPAGAGGLGGESPPAMGEPATTMGDRATARPLDPLTPAAQALYDRGYTLFHQGLYVDAESSFQKFLQAYPGTELSDNASYWIGECRYARVDLRGALAAFREMLSRYPEGNKVPDAMLKVADCLAGVGDREGARAAYAEVMERFPNSAASAMAEERRSRLR